MKALTKGAGFPIIIGISRLLSWLTDKTYQARSMSYAYIG
jgi:hypothetical protein